MLSKDLIHNINGINGNCIGTALYITQCIDHDIFIHPEEFQKNIVSQLQETNTPQEGGLITIHYYELPEPIHMAVVSSLKPFKVHHRFFGEFYENVLWEKIRTKYKNATKYRYFTPRKVHNLNL